MTFDELFAQTGERANSDDHNDFMVDSAVVELRKLRSLAQPVTPGRHTAEENARILVIECMEDSTMRRQMRRALRVRRAGATIAVDAVRANALTRIWGEYAMVDDHYDAIVKGTSQGGRFLPVELAKAG